MNPQASLQDPNYNVIAIADDNGNILTEYTFSPYGQLIAETTHAPHPPNHLGHQGLFFTTYADPATPDTPNPFLPLTPYAEGTYHNRNRDLIPQLGRFLQRDPNATAQPLVLSTVFNGRSWYSVLSWLELKEHFADGVNTHLYLGGNPLDHRDPLGLDFQDDIDDAIAGLIGERVAAATSITAQIGQAFNAAQLLGGLAISILPGSDAINVIASLAKGDKVGLDDIVYGVASIGGAALIGKAVTKTFRYLRTAKNARRIQQVTGLPVGRTGKGGHLTNFPGINVANSATVIGGRLYRGHALDRMQEVGLIPSVVEGVIHAGQHSPGNDPGTFVHIYENVKVVVNSAGDVITAYTLGP